MWLIYNKADLPNPPCLPSVRTAPNTPVLVPPSKFITQVGINFCAKSDGKDSDTKGSIKFSLSGGNVIASHMQIPVGEWNKNSKHTISKNLKFKLTQAQLTQRVNVHIDWITQGHDQMFFSASIFVKFSDGKSTVHCIDSQQIRNCGDRCGFSGCPTNHCNLDLQSFSLINVQTVTNKQCC